MPSRRERLVGFQYRPAPGLNAEVRKSCRDELKILYTGGPFDRAAWERLSVIAPLQIFEASKLNPRMKDIVRVHADGLRVEGARDGELVVAFFAPSRRREWRKRLEALLSGRERQ